MRKRHILAANEEIERLNGLLRKRGFVDEKMAEWNGGLRAEVVKLTAKLSEAEAKLCSVPPEFGDDPEFVTLRAAIEVGDDAAIVAAFPAIHAALWRTTDKLADAEAWIAEQRCENGCHAQIVWTSSSPGCGTCPPCKARKGEGR